MTGVTLNAADAAELAEMLQFLADWLKRDPGRLGASLEDFVGHPAYNTRQLRGPGPVHLPARRQRPGNLSSAHRSDGCTQARLARPAEDTPGLHGVNVVRPRAARCGR
jgi:hypothetical protein